MVIDHRLTVEAVFVDSRDEDDYKTGRRGERCWDATEEGMHGISAHALCLRDLDRLDPRLSKCMTVSRFLEWQSMSSYISPYLVQRCGIQQSHGSRNDVTSLQGQSPQQSLHDCSDKYTAAGSDR